MKQCKQPVDKYIELDDLLVFIDFLLLKIQAHRHVLFNIESISRNHIVKLACALILSNAYIKWFHLKNEQFQSILNHDHHIFYALEWGFYFKFILFLRAFILASIGQLFVLPLLIWNPSHKEYYGGLSIVYVALCSTQALNASELASPFLSLIASTVSILMSKWFVSIWKIS
ncbi:unnamed protein product [Didymodactylos carnosus]|uniref:Protein ARV n=1 Tax=Didymodactylos carnosus TaxID=1234261 RepID=A0A813NWT9_9BILA|nr:unnamed protein product [Didymodactylos carnosus]CAF3521108.1 unnamed protein product [Didymodactylos carnosus]